MSEELVAVVQTIPDGQQYVSAMLSLNSIFPASLAANDMFRDKITASYQHLLSHGAKRAVAKLADASSASDQ